MGAQEEMLVQSVLPGSIPPVTLYSKSLFPDVEILNFATCPFYCVFYCQFTSGLLEISICKNPQFYVVQEGEEGGPLIIAGQSVPDREGDVV